MKVKPAAVTAGDIAPVIQKALLMLNIKVDSALWQSSVLPEGIVERWLVPDGVRVAAGTPIVELLIEDALHEITAPGDGVLSIRAEKNAVIDPGSVLAEIR